MYGSSTTCVTLACCTSCAWSSGFCRSTTRAANVGSSTIWSTCTTTQGYNRYCTAHNRRILTINTANFFATDSSTACTNCYSIGNTSCHCCRRFGAGTTTGHFSNHTRSISTCTTTTRPIIAAARSTTSNNNIFDSCRSTNWRTVYTTNVDIATNSSTTGHYQRTSCGVR